MSAPIFFSVASKDVELAERIFDRFRRGDIYLYTRTGKNGAWFWDEIEREELPFAKGVVFFWSSSFVKGENTLRELRLARKLFDEGRLQDCVIIRLDETQLVKDPALPALEPKHAEAVELVSAFLSHSRSDPLKSVEAEALRMVSDLHGRVKRPRIPFQRRPVLQDQLETAIERDATTYYPALWVSGFNGNGRKTLVRELFRSIASYAHEIDIFIDETSLPEQILMRMESQYSGLMMPELRERVKESRGATPADVAAMIEKLSRDDRYVLLQQSRLYEENVRVPEWLDEVISALTPGRLPKLVIVSQLPTTEAQRLELADNMAFCTVPGMIPSEAISFTKRVVNIFGERNGWWDNEAISRVAEATTGKPELILTVVRQVSAIDNADRLDDILGREAERFSDTLTKIIDYAMKRLANDPQSMLILRVLDEVSPLAREDVQSFLGIEESVSTSLVKLVDLGLVEVTEPGLFRISPLLSNRLKGELLTPELNAQYKESIRRFAEAGLQVDGGELGYVRIETKIQAELLAGKSELSEEVSEFASVAHFLSVGIRLYNQNRYQDAEPLLRRAFFDRSSFTLTAQIEAGRFFGLVCIKLKDREAFDQVFNAMNARHQSKPIAYFLQGEWQRVVERKWFEAIGFFHKAWQHAHDNNDKEREEKVLAPYINCILKTPKPDLVQAKKLADRAVFVNKKKWSLWRQAEVYLMRWYHYTGPDVREIELDYYDVMDELQVYPGGKPFFHQVYARELELKQEWDDAVDNMVLANPDKKLGIDLKRWGLMVRSQRKDLVEKVIAEIKELCETKARQQAKTIYATGIADIYAKALNTIKELKKFKITNLGLPLSDAKVTEIYTNARRGDAADWEYDD